MSSKPVSAQTSIGSHGILRHGLPCSAVLLFLFSLVVLRITLVPTVYAFDSAELAIGAATLGLVHAPGYPLYLLVAHLFTGLPVGDIAFRVNLFSALSLALSTPLLYTVLRRLQVDRRVAVSVAFSFVFLYDVWLSGIAAEIYAPQVLTLVLLAYTLTWLLDDRVSSRHVLGIGFAFGMAVAMAPSSVFFAPAVVLTFVLKRISWKQCLAGALAASLVFCCSLAYFPIRYDADPTLNLLGAYDARGVFQPVNLQTIEGIVWVLRGAQFDRLFFVQGTPFLIARVGQRFRDPLRQLSGDWLRCRASGDDCALQTAAQSVSGMADSLDTVHLFLLAVRRS